MTAVIEHMRDNDGLTAPRDPDMVDGSEEAVYVRTRPDILERHHPPAARARRVVDVIVAMLGLRVRAQSGPRISRRSASRVAVGAR